MNSELMVGGALLVLAGTGVGVMLREGLAKARFDRKVKTASVEELERMGLLSAPTPRDAALSWAASMDPAPRPDHYRTPTEELNREFDAVVTVSTPTGGDAGFARRFFKDDAEAERVAAWQTMRDRMFPPSLQHYWVPNGALPGADGKWWVFIGAARTTWGFSAAMDAVAKADDLNRQEKRGKYHPGRATGVMVADEPSAIQRAMNFVPDWVQDLPPGARYMDLGRYNKDGRVIGVDLASGPDETTMAHRCDGCDRYTNRDFCPHCGRTFDGGPDETVQVCAEGWFIAKTPTGEDTISGRDLAQLGAINAAGEYEPLSDAPGAHYEAIAYRDEGFRVALTAPNRPPAIMGRNYHRLRDARGAATKLNRAMTKGEWMTDAIKRTKNG